ncbi:MAG TPA: EAL domain-containing protein [Methyloceanibacter sp.]|nr:EAL domain-containing protein [Methyloceanibacter sp.]
MLDVIVLIAMAITAAAFAVGLTVQAGLPLLPVLIATAALFLVMAASFIMLGRAPRSGGGGGERLDELKEALEIIDSDLQRIDRVEDDVARLDLLTDRVERLDQALGGGASLEVPGGQARVEELATEFENVYARIEALRADVDAENRSQRDRIAGDLAGLEVMIKQLSGDLAQGTTATAGLARETWSATPDTAVEKVDVEEIEEIELEIPDEPSFAAADEPLVETITEIEAETEEPLGDPFAEESDDDTGALPPLSLGDAELFEQHETAELDSSEAAAAASVLARDDDDDDDDRMLRTIHTAVENGRIELYLQPTVTLPDRKLQYFEGLTRIRTAADSLVLPGDYVPVAKRAGLMPLIDNVMLVRSVQTLRRLAPSSAVKGVFGNVSMHSLLDPDYFPELVEFMEENSSLSESLVFEVSQPEMLGLTEAELSCLDTLGALGYSFCLDNVSDLDADFGGLSDRYFRYIKISAAKFLDGPGRTAADLKRQLDGLGMQLIIEKVEEEGDVAELLDHGIELAQGYLFGAPAPMDEALSSVPEDAGAA